MSSSDDFPSLLARIIAHARAFYKIAEMWKLWRAPPRTGGESGQAAKLDL